MTLRAAPHPLRRSTRAGSKLQNGTRRAGEYSVATHEVPMATASRMDAGMHPSFFKASEKTCALS